MFASKINKLFFLILFLSLFFFFNSKKNNDSNIGYISSNTFLLSSFDLSKIITEDVYLNFINSTKGIETLNLLQERNIPKKIRNLIQNPSLIGLDYKKDIYIYSSIYSEEIENIHSKISLNFIFPIKDLKLVSKNINQYVDFIPDKYIDIFDGEIEDFKYYLIKDRFKEKKDLVMLSYNKDVLLLSICPINEAIHIDLKKELSAILDGFNLRDTKNLFYLNDNEVSIWLNLNKLSDSQINFLFNDYSYIKHYFSNFLLSFSFNKEGIELKLFSFFNFNLIISEISDILAVLSKKTLHLMYTDFNIESILKIDNIVLNNESNLDMKLNHKLHLDKYEISIKEKIFIDNQQLESYISDYLLDFIAIF